MECVAGWDQCECQHVSSVLIRVHQNSSQITWLLDNQSQSGDWRQVGVSLRPFYKRAKSCFYFPNRAKSRPSPGTRGLKVVKETSLRCVWGLNQRQNNNCEENSGNRHVLSILSTYLTLQHLIIHITVSQTAELLHPVCHFNHHHAFFILLFFLYHSCSCESEQDKLFREGLNYFGFLQWRRGLHIGKVTGSSERRPFTDFTSERVTVWRETEGKRLFCFICGVGGLKLTNTSRLPHWADPNVENKGEKVYSTIPGHVGFCLSLSAHILIWDTLCLQPETGIVHKNLLF